MTFLVGISIKLTLASAEFKTMASLGSAEVATEVDVEAGWAKACEPQAMRTMKMLVARLCKR